MKKLLILSLLFTAGLFSCGTANRAATNARGTASNPYLPRPVFDSAGVVIGTHALFQGGNIELFRRWVGERLVYPRDAQTALIEGRVVVSFVVDEAGNVGDAEIVQSPHPGMSFVVVRIVLESPTWTPACDLEGNPHAIRYDLPVDFKLQKPDGPYRNGVPSNIPPPNIPPINRRF
jgi:TonB family protein